MKKFMDENFLLQSEIAKKIYHGYAENLPIIDYHCHLPSDEIAENKRFSNITELWLYKDHYKWRAMRQSGVDEKYITGNASDYEKFREYCRIMPMLAGNPLFHWSHLELKRYFDCDLIICEENCDKIWELTGERLYENDMCARSLIKKSGVALLCTTEDPCDSLENHKYIKDSEFDVQVLPTFRPDKILNIEKETFCAYICRLEQATGIKITDLESLCNSLKVSLDKFEASGCKIAYLGINNYIVFEKPDPYHADMILKKAFSGKKINMDEAAFWKCQIMRFFCGEYKKRSWVMQIHYGVPRNQQMFCRLEPGSGLNTIYGKSCINELSLLLNYLDSNDILPRTLIYSVNPSDNAYVAALCTSFCKGINGIPTVMQESAWWFNDNINGIYAQMNAFANLSSFGHFLGMPTDSMSFISYTKHEYFRRILCNLIGEWVEYGLYPDNEEIIGQLVQNIAFYNARDFFGFEV